MGKGKRFKGKRICSMESSSPSAVVRFSNGLTRRFGLIGDDATDEVRRRAAQRRHQIIQLLL